MKIIKSIKQRELEIIERETELITLSQKLYQQQLMLSKMMQQFSKQIIADTSNKSQIQPTINQVLNRFVIKNDKTKEETQRKYKIINKYIHCVGLKLKDKYSKFHNEQTLLNIVDKIANRSDIQGNQKIRHLRWIVSFVKFAVFAYPDLYKTDVLVGLPSLKRTPKSAKRPHTPYTDEQLKHIFNPAHEFFHKNPDFFWGCMIALFTGSRKNAAFTLQYKDIIQRDGVWCFNFIEDYPGIKKLKTEDSERLVPIHSDLIKMGFLDYIYKKSHCLDNNFIFPICLTSHENLNCHITNGFFAFLKQIGIKKTGSERYDFHSFRKNANITMERCGIIRSYIDKIIGWMSTGSEGERSYSNYTIKQISEQLELLHYDCLKEELKQWKKIMADIHL